jgi:hypothetical protein
VSESAAVFGRLAAFLALLLPESRDFER